jgi:hypothetical protein
MGSTYADSVALHQARKREVGEELYSAKSWGGGGEEGSWIMWKMMACKRNWNGVLTFKERLCGEIQRGKVGQVADSEEGVADAEKGTGVADMRQANDIGAEINADAAKYVPEQKSSSKYWWSMVIGGWSVGRNVHDDSDQP